MKAKRFFKIRHKTTSLFSNGGDTVSLDGSGYGWSAEGKIWKGMGPLKNHLAQYLPKGDSGYARGKFNQNIARVVGDWEVVEIVMTEKQTIPMNDLYNDFEIIKRAGK
jgi:hypothetical protein